MPFQTFCSAKSSTCIAVRLLKFSVLHGNGESKYRPVATENFQCLKILLSLSHPCWGKRLSGQCPSICCRRPALPLESPTGALTASPEPSPFPKPCSSFAPLVRMRRVALHREGTLGRYVPHTRCNDGGGDALQVDSHSVLEAQVGTQDLYPHGRHGSESCSCPISARNRFRRFRRMTSRTVLRHAEPDTARTV